MKLLLLLLFVTVTFASPFENPKENSILNEFRNQVEKNLTQEYMHSDTYLKRWLSLAKGDLSLAVEKLTENLEWREENDIDTLISEDFSELHADYPTYKYARDKLGRPVIFLDLGKWNLRAASLQGLMPKLLRYMISFYETAAWKVYEADKLKVGDGTATAVGNMDGFSSTTHLCRTCTPLLLQFFECLETYYAYLFKEIIAINTPDSFNTVYMGFHAFAGERVKEILKIFKDQSKWLPYLDSIIDRDQRNFDYGGTREF